MNNLGKNGKLAITRSKERGNAKFTKQNFTPYYRSVRANRAQCRERQHRNSASLGHGDPHK